MFGYTAVTNPSGMSNLTLTVILYHEAVKEFMSHPKKDHQSLFAFFDLISSLYLPLHQHPVVYNPVLVLNMCVCVLFVVGDPGDPVYHDDVFCFLRNVKYTPHKLFNMSDTHFQGKCM